MYGQAKLLKQTYLVHPKLSLCFQHPQFVYHKLSSCLVLSDRFMKPLLTHARPSLMDTMPKCCLPLARLLTTEEQLSQVCRSCVHLTLSWARFTVIVLVSRNVFIVFCSVHISEQVYTIAIKFSATVITGKKTFKKTIDGLGKEGM